MKQSLIELKKWGVNIDEALDRIYNDEDLYEECLILISQDDGFDKILSSINEKNYDMAFKYTHQLKGVVANASLTPLSVTICELTEELRSKKYDNLEPLVKNVMDAFDQFKTIMISSN